MKWKKTLMGLALSAYLTGCGEQQNPYFQRPTLTAAEMNKSTQEQEITTDFCRTPKVEGECEDFLPEPNYNLNEFPQPFLTEDGKPNGMIVISGMADDAEVEAGRIIASQLGYDKDVGCNEDFICDRNGQIVYQFETIGPVNVRNLILVGTPCNNRSIRDTLQTENCECRFYEGSVFGHKWLNGTTTLYVTGPTGQEVYEAATMLTQQRFKPLLDKSNSIRTTDVCYENLE